jgi:FMN phosphatase YigB (HAD superfamily)
MKVVLFDLGNTLEHQDVLLPGARETLQAIQEMRDHSGEAVALALVSDFDMPDDPEQIPIIRQRYYEILEGLSIRSFFEPVAGRVTLSSEVGVFKPDEKIFRAAIEKINEGLCFGDVVFVTENRGHVIETRRLGMRAIHFQGPGQNAGDVDWLVDVIPLVQELLGLQSNNGNRTSG